MRWVVCFIGLSLGGSLCADEDRLRVATDNAWSVLQKAGRNWQAKQTCFACHHQTLPLAASAALGHPDPAWRKSQADHTHAFFERRHDSLNEGKPLGGGSFTAVQGLWALRLDNRPPDETTAAMVAYLLHLQGKLRRSDDKPKDGRWRTSCVRPPLQSSEIEATVLALTQMRPYVTAEQQTAFAAAELSARAWLKTVARPNAIDQAWYLWGMHELGQTEAVPAARRELLASQHEDGGWSQTPQMSSDALASGLALAMLRQTGSSPEEPALRRAMEYLLKTQHADGSWFVATRVKPVQPPFDNGDPHGKHQFLSISATAWATIGLARMQTTSPK